MKKISLLLAIACVGALNGMMEKPDWSFLPEIRQEIIMKNLEASKTLNETVIIIKKASELKGMILNNPFNNPKDFTVLVHMLAKKFNKSVNAIAKKLDTPTAKNYVMLSEKLGAAIKVGNVKKVKKLINQGADVHFLINKEIISDTSEDSDLKAPKCTMLEIAINTRSEKQVAIVEILLNHGANPYATAGKRYSLGTLIDDDDFSAFYSVDVNESENYELKQLIFPKFKKLLLENIRVKPPKQLDEDKSTEGNVSGE